MNTIRLDSNWWYGVAIPPVLELVGGGGILVAGRLGLIQDGANPLTILVPGFTLLAGLFLIPVFALCLFLTLVPSIRATPRGIHDRCSGESAAYSYR